ncbi:MAG: SsrA-binding protein SmpB [FCB group bacterium]|nr:SsrA-binding protein SmpB [FCB group bacterium]
MDGSIVAKNRKAFHDFHILDTIEAGIELKGSEVKSLREGRANLRDAYVDIRGGNAYLVGVHISPYSHTGFVGHEPTRDRRLLLHKREILKLRQLIAEKGVTAIPLKLYFRGSWAKVELGIAKGKKTYDKKAALKARDIKRETDREMNRYPK